MLNLITVCTDDYPMIYAEKLHKRFEQVTALNVNHYCITDRPHDVSVWADPIIPYKKSKGWWNKLNLYSPDIPDGQILYMDLDIVILQNFDNEIARMIEREETMCCVSDAIGWMGEKFSSSLMCFQSGTHTHIYDKFFKQEKDINTLEGGDQVWTGPQLSSVYYVDADFPDLKKNLKFHLAQRNGNNLTIPSDINGNIKLIDCGGRPKPHELSMLPYIKNNWHDIQ